MDKLAFNSLGASAFLPPQHNSANAVVESWAMGVEWQFAMERYVTKFKRPVYSYSYKNNLQDRRIAPFNAQDSHLIYTSLVVDMIDFNNQGLNDIGLPKDRVEGYTIKEAERGLKGATSWNAWRDNMKGISNTTSNRLDELFNNWY